ncbi:MAG: hypothetical protein NVS1B11_28340 [Terriglobales bacterium]
MVTAPHISYKGLVDIGVKLLPPSSEEFFELLTAAAEPKLLSAIQPILPYSVIVKNNTPERLLMVTVRISPDFIGNSAWQTITLGTISNDPLDSFTPGSAVLVTPVTQLNRVLPQKRIMQIPEADTLKFRLAQLVGQSSLHSELEVVLDAIVFADGRVIGPDVSRTMDIVNLWADAEDDVISGILSRSGDDIAAYLESIRNNPVVNAGATKPDQNAREFVECRQRFAGDLLDQKSAFKSEEDFLRFLGMRYEARIPKLWKPQSTSHPE